MRLLLLSWSIALPEVRALNVGRHRYRCATLLADQHAFDVLDELVRLEPLVQDMGPDSVFLAAVPAFHDEEVSRREVGQLQRPERRDVDFPTRHNENITETLWARQGSG